VATTQNTSASTTPGRGTTAAERSAIAKKGAATRKRAAAKRSTAAKKAAATRNSTTAARSPAKSTGRRTRSTAKRQTRSAAQANVKAAEVTAKQGRSLAERAALVSVGVALETRDRFATVATDVVDTLTSRSAAERRLRKRRRDVSTRLRRFERRGQTETRKARTSAGPIAASSARSTRLSVMSKAATTS
jgi:hypothetical protein